MLPTPLLFDPVLTNLSQLNQGLWLSGVRIQVAQFMEASIQRMLVRGLNLNIEPVESNLRELKGLERQFSDLSDELQVIDFNTHRIITEAALSMGVNIDAPYTPPRNFSPPALEAQFQRDIDSTRYWSDRQRWVPIADDEVSGERIMSLFEMGQWIQTNMRSVISLTTPQFFGGATDPSVTALFGSSMMPRRVWPAYNRSVQARITTLQHYSNSSTGDTAVVTVIAAVTLSVIICAVAVLDSLFITDSMHAPLRLGASMRDSVVRAIQASMTPRISELAGLGKASASVALDFGLEAGGHLGVGDGGHSARQSDSADDDGNDSTGSEAQPLIRLPSGDSTHLSQVELVPTDGGSPLQMVTANKLCVPSLRDPEGGQGNDTSTAASPVLQLDDSGRRPAAVRVATNGSGGGGRRRDAE
jgi:hypothetical protein